MHRSRGVLDERFLVLGISGPLPPRSLTHVMSAFLGEWGMALPKVRDAHASHMLAVKLDPEVAGPFLDRDHHGYLGPIDAEHAGEAAAAVDVAMRAAINRRTDDIG